MSGSPTSTPLLHPQRPPPPSLFLGPPSHNASNLSLPPPSNSQPSQSRPQILRPHSNRFGEPTVTLPRSRPQNPPPAQTEGDRTDALWAEMQATLAEVEASAFSSTHVFGPAHNAALEELRDAQIALAQAWGRTEADDDEVMQGEGKKGRQDGRTEPDGNGDAEDEGDIVEARRRREANERFFKRVGEGVVDVVGKLEGVAQAMSKVEKESREIWSESESAETASVAS